MKKGKILMLDGVDEKKEIEFEVKHLLSFTTKQRFKKMIQMSKLMRTLFNYGIGRTINKSVK